MAVNYWKEQLGLYFMSIGALECDNEGRVWRKKRVFGKNKLKDIKPKRVDYIGVNGYRLVPIQQNNKKYQLFAHRLVWLTFNGFIPDDLEVNHIDGVKYNNNPNNLELVDHRQNQLHRFETLGHKPFIGEEHGMAILSGKNVIEIRDLYNTGHFKQTELGHLYGISKEHANSIVKRIIWRHLP